MPFSGGSNYLGGGGLNSFGLSQDDGTVDIFGSGRERNVRPRRTFPISLPVDNSLGVDDDCISRCLREAQVIGGGGGIVECLAGCNQESGKGAPGTTPTLGTGETGTQSSGGGGGGGGGINFENIAALFNAPEKIPSFLNNPLLQQLSAFLSRKLEGPFGLDPDVIRRQRNVITGSGAQREQQALQNLAASLNTVGQTGGGRQIQLGREITENTGRQVSGQLNDLANLDAMKAQQDRDAIVGQILGFGGLAGQDNSQQISQNLGIGDLELRHLLGTLGIDLQRELGLGNLALGNRGLDLQRLIAIANMLAQQQGTNAGFLGV